MCWLTLREERRLRVSENSLLRKKFGPEGDGVIREVEETRWAVTQNCSSDQIEKNEMDGASSMYGGEVRGIQGVGGET
jgi:hypothetical protein